MKKTSQIQGTLLLALSAAILTGCGREEYTRRCVDDDGLVLPDQACAATTGYAMYRHPHWIFVGRNTIYRNNHVSSGFYRTMPSSGTIKSSTGGVIRAAPSERGGFGGSGSSFGG